jgi:hypothetical protein
MGQRHRVRLLVYPYDVRHPAGFTRERGDDHHGKHRIQVRFAAGHYTKVVAQTYADATRQAMIDQIETPDGDR